MTSFGTSQYQSRLSGSTGSSRNVPLNVVYPFRLDYTLSRRHDYIPARRQNHLPQIRQDYVPPTRQDYVPPPREDYVPSARHDYVTSTRHDYVHPVGEDNTPQIRQNHLSPSTQVYMPATNGDNVLPTRQDYVPPPRNDYIPNRTDYVSQNRQDYGPQRRQDYVVPSRRDYYAQDYEPQNRRETNLTIRQDYVPRIQQDYHLQSRRIHVLQSSRNYGSQSRRDIIPQNRRVNDPQNRYGTQNRPNRVIQYYGPLGTRNSSPQSQEDYTLQHREVYGSQIRPNYNSDHGLQRGQDQDPQNRQDYGGNTGNGINSERNYSSCDSSYESETLIASSHFNAEYVRDQQNPNESRNLRENTDDQQHYDIGEEIQNSENSRPTNSILDDLQNPSTSQNCHNSSTSSGGITENDNKSLKTIDGVQTKLTGKIKGSPADLQKFCKYCKINCSGRKAYKVHISSNEHKMKKQLAKEWATLPKEILGSGNLKGTSTSNGVCSDEFSHRTKHDEASTQKKVKRMHKTMGKPLSKCDLGTVNAVADRAVPVEAEFIELHQPQGTDKFLCNPCDKQMNEHKISSLCKGNQHKRIYSWKLREENKRVSSEKCDPNKIVKDSGPFDVDDSSFWEEEGIRNRVNAKNSQFSQELLNVRKYGYSKHHMKAVKGETITNNPLFGEEYIVGRESKLNDKHEKLSTQLYCKLCDCSLDPKSRDKHLKGKRHRLSYREKIVLSLLKEPVQEYSLPFHLFLTRKREDQRKSIDNIATGQDVDLNSGSIEGEKFNEIPEYIKDQQNNVLLNLPTFTDRLIALKDESIYPEDSQLEQVVCSISECELALKNTCTKISNGDMENGDNNSVNSSKNKKCNNKTIPYTNQREEIENNKNDNVNIGIKTVVRIGYFAKDLMLRGENVLTLVVLCEEIPTVQLLNNYYRLFCEELKVMSGNDNYEINLIIKDATIIVNTKGDTKIIINIVFTSTKLAEEIDSQKENLINQEIYYFDKPFDALVQIRRMRWFKAKLENNFSSLVVLRILRSMCNENQAWSSLSCWILELLIQSVNESIEDETVAGILRKFLEALSAGMLLPDSQGIYDPCEKKPTDATNYLTLQQRLDITTFAQFILRRMSFNCINSVLHTVFAHEVLKFIPREERIREVDKRHHESNHLLEGTKSKKLKTAIPE